MAAREIFLLPYGGGGWLQARFYDDGIPSRPSRSEGSKVLAPNGRAFVRLEPNAAGEWRPREWRLPSYHPDVLRRIPYHRILLAFNADQDLQRELAAKFEGEPPAGFSRAFGQVKRDEPITIRRPRGRRLPESFYEHVGLVYRQAVGRGLKPRQAIADAASVSPDVAGRWIYEARKRGLIPKTTPGKVTV